MTPVVAFAMESTEGETNMDYQLPARGVQLQLSRKDRSGSVGLVVQGGSS